MEGEVAQQSQNAVNEHCSDLSIVGCHALHLAHAYGAERTCGRVRTAGTLASVVAR